MVVNCLGDGVMKMVMIEEVCKIANIRDGFIMLPIRKGPKIKRDHSLANRTFRNYNKSNRWLKEKERMK